MIALAMQRNLAAGVAVAAIAVALFFGLRRCESDCEKAARLFCSVSNATADCYRLALYNCATGSR